MPDVEPCVRRPSQRFAAELIEIDPSLDTCETCGLEWDGCQKPPGEGPERHHADMWRMYGEAKDVGVNRRPGEPMLAYLDRFYLSTAGRFWGCTWPDGHVGQDTIDERRRFVAHPARGAARAGAAVLAREGDEHIMPAAIAVTFLC
ncbi:hypothetical protein WME92_36090 [Sorangium sp. So ce307]